MSPGTSETRTLCAFDKTRRFYPHLREADKNTIRPPAITALPSTGSYVQTQVPVAPAAALPLLRDCVGTKTSRPRVPGRPTAAVVVIQFILFFCSPFLLCPRRPAHPPRGRNMLIARNLLNGRHPRPRARARPLHVLLRLQNTAYRVPVYVHARPFRNHTFVGYTVVIVVIA